MALTVLHNCPGGIRFQDATSEYTYTDPEYRPCNNITKQSEDSSKEQWMFVGQANMCKNLVLGRRVHPEGNRDSG